jgi:hypothetical protein
MFLPSLVGVYLASRISPTSGMVSQISWSSQQIRQLSVFLAASKEGRKAKKYLFADSFPFCRAGQGFCTRRTIFPLQMRARCTSSIPSLRIWRAFLESKGYRSRLQICGVNSRPETVQEKELSEYLRTVSLGLWNPQ